MMFEVGQISDSARYAYNRETRRNHEDKGVKFSEAMYNTGEFPETALNMSYENGTIDEDNEFETIVDIVIYTFTGRATIFKKFSGINVDLKV